MNESSSPDKLLYESLTCLCRVFPPDLNIIRNAINNLSEDEKHMVYQQSESCYHEHSGPLHLVCSYSLMLEPQLLIQLIEALLPIISVWSLNSEHKTCLHKLVEFFPQTEEYLKMRNHAVDLICDAAGRDYFVDDNYTGKINADKVQRYLLIRSAHGHTPLHLQLFEFFSKEVRPHNSRLLTMEAAYPLMSRMNLINDETRNTAAPCTTSASSLLEPDEHGETILHSAVRCGVQLDYGVFKALLQIVPKDFVSEKSVGGASFLQWIRLMNLLLSAFNDSSPTAVGGDNSTASSSLSMLSCYFLRLHTCALNIKFFSMQRSDQSISKFYYQIKSQSCAINNLIHFAKATGQDEFFCMWKRIRLLLLARHYGVTGDSERLFDEAENGLYLIHAAAGLPLCPLCITVFLILVSCEECVRIKDDKNGMYPLHVACQVGEWRSSQLFLEVWEDAASIHADSGRLPLHFALSSSGFNLQTIDLLIQAEPRAVNTRDPISGLYPFMLASAVDLSYPYLQRENFNRNTNLHALNLSFRLLLHDPTVIDCCLNLRNEQVAHFYDINSL